MKINKFLIGIFLGTSPFLAIAENDSYEGVTFSKISNLSLKIDWDTGCYLEFTADAQNNIPGFQVYVKNEDEIKYLPYSQNNPVIYQSYDAEASLTYDISGLELSEGDYTFVIPDGYMYIFPNYKKTSVPQMEFNFTIGNDSDPNPGPDYKATLIKNNTNVYNIKLSGVTSIEPTGDGIAFLENEDQQKTELHIGSNPGKDPLTLTESYDTWQGFRLNLNYGNLELKDGSYTLIIPEGYLKINGAIYNKEIAVSGIEYSNIYPTASSQEIERLSIFENTLKVKWLTADNGDVIKVTPYGKGNPWIENSNNSDHQSIPKENITFNDSGFEIDLTGISLNDGETYFLSIPEGYVLLSVYGETLETLLNLAQRIPFYNISTSEIVPSWTPENGTDLSDNHVISVSWGDNSLSYVDGVITANLYDFADTKSFELSWNEEVKLNETGRSLLIDLSRLDTGDYTIIIPEGYIKFEVDGKPYFNAETDASYAISSSGINSVYQEPKINNIYDLKGNKVFNDPQKGLYIINGKKIMVKR